MSEKLPLVGEISPIGLMFHGIGVPARDLEPGEERYWISVELFEEILDLVRDRKNVAISFDDGNASDVEIALDALRRRDMRAMFFPIADRLGKPGSLDSDGLRALRSEGMLIGSHGMRHMLWKKMSAADIEAEFVLARDMIQDSAGAVIDTVACPFGGYDRRSLAALERLGYRRVFTSDHARSVTEAWLQPRYTVEKHTDTMSKVKTVLNTEPKLLTHLVDVARITGKRLR
jgi:peptidoglycan/xylan/chitin deacetylase (PgdA/CDA1 family)